MTLDELIQQGWGDHDSNSSEVAERLEAHLDLVTDDQGAAGFMNLAGHTIGDHMGDRPRARALCEAVVERLGASAGELPLLYLTVARTLDGDDEAAAAARAALGEDPAVGVRVGMLVASGRMHAGQWADAATLYDDALARADALPEGHAAERATAVTSNTVASELLELETRDDVQDDLMERAAHASRKYWLRIGNWVNDERGDYLLALVHTALGRPAEGRQFAESGLRTIAEADGEERVDEAFLHLARAQACRDGGDASAQQASIARAEALAADFEGQGLRDWFDGELEKSR